MCPARIAAKFPPLVTQLATDVFPPGVNAKTKMPKTFLPRFRAVIYVISLFRFQK